MFGCARLCDIEPVQPVQENSDANACASMMNFMRTRGLNGFGIQESIQSSVAFVLLASAGDASVVEEVQAATLQRFTVARTHERAGCIICNCHLRRRQPEKSTTSAESGPRRILSKKAYRDCGAKVCSQRGLRLLIRSSVLICLVISSVACRCGYCHSQRSSLGVHSWL